MEQESAFMSALLIITTFKYEGEKLVGYTVGPERRLLTFVPVAAVPLEGVTWEVALLADSKGSWPR
jgi:hypothetical protein